MEGPSAPRWEGEGHGATRLFRRGRAGGSPEGGQELGLAGLGAREVLLLHMTVAADLQRELCDLEREGVVLWREALGELAHHRFVLADEAPLDLAFRHVAEGIDDGT